jgi:REP-associated tyrosine transposase
MRATGDGCVPSAAGMRATGGGDACHRRWGCVLSGAGGGVAMKRETMTNGGYLNQPSDMYWRPSRVPSEKRGIPRMSSNKYNPDRYTRRSLRLPDRDYTSRNAYFVTIPADKLQPLFEIPALRTILEETWHALPERFPGISLDEFIIMPDHIHFILWLEGAGEHAPTLGSVVGAYKSLTTVAWIRYVEANKLIQYPGHIWHRNYYERVVRIGALEATRQYIRNNPKRRKDKDTARGM